MAMRRAQCARTLTSTKECVASVAERDTGHEDGEGRGDNMERLGKETHHRGDERRGRAAGGERRRRRGADRSGSRRRGSGGQRDRARRQSEGGQGLGAAGMAGEHAVVARGRHERQPHARLAERDSPLVAAGRRASGHRFAREGRHTSRRRPRRSRPVALRVVRVGALAAVALAGPDTRATVRVTRNADAVTGALAFFLDEHREERLGALVHTSAAHTFSNILF